MPVQINGKVRARLTVPADIAEERLRELALADPQVREAPRGQDGARKSSSPAARLVSIVA